MSSKDFCDGLRDGARKLASGEKESTYLRDIDIQTVLGENAGRVKVTPAYIRTTMNRVAEVKEVGSVSVRRVTGDPELPDGYRISLVKETRKRVFTDKDLPGIKQKANAKLVKELLNIMPNIADLEGEQLQGAAIGIKRYQDLIKSMVEQGE